MLASLKRRGKTTYEARVIRLLGSAPRKVLGLYEEPDGRNGIGLVNPTDRKLKVSFDIRPADKNGALPGDIVWVEPAGGALARRASVIERVGPMSDPRTVSLISIAANDIPVEFPPAALEEAERARAAPLGQRLDLRDTPLVTIDGEDARDFDDAVFCEPAKIGRVKANNGWRLIVAIADVSHYVKPGEPIDDDAYERATSVYFPRRVIPMLPEKLSNGLCSLNPYEDRLAMVCDMLVTASGEIHAYQFFPAVICSQARFTYTEVAAILANTRGPEAAKRKELVPDLLNLHEVYRALLKERQRRGAIDFETTETQIVCDDNGRIEKIVPRTRTEAHKLIEEAMLAANVCSADFIARAKHPSLYRVHEGPTPEKKVLLQNFLRALGLGLSIGDDPKPGEFQAIAAATKDRPDATQIHTMLLRSMQQAIYTGINSGHFGLAYEAYTHFTSPIRRYPDLLVHRVIKALLGGKRYHLVTGASNPAPSNRKTTKPVRQATAEEEKWEVAGVHCSVNERRADEASRDVEAWLKCRYMREHLGEEYGGTVTAVTSFGLFVTLDGLYVEGLVHITELGGEYYRFDEVRQELRGERSGVRYAVGSRVRVQVSRVDLDGRKIDFRLVRDGEDDASVLRVRRDKSAAAAAELAVVKDTDRAVKAATKRKTRGGSGSGAHPVRAAKKAAREGGGRSAGGKSGARR
ncbi:MAG TPA: ribonuclease R [Burkholderiaceae bacterium]|nr:ribonuclease R [Burkholderiaceae bacterium]